MTLRHLERDAAGQQRHDELVEADALLRGSSCELVVQGGWHAYEDLAAGFHDADSIAYAIDNASSACDTTCMSNAACTANYLATFVMYGGVSTRRADVIADLQRIAPSQAHVDRYMQGLDLAQGAR